ncbi:MAG: dolichyl-phosphate-mannose--protein mannosyltransferase [Sphingomonas bacterium]|uniref:phospholipid carrier-dependent glycosyltransferase n=1 Tax=Sphingomonas bacterium TaxID=1895847 RepID=UPI0026357C3C|nr:phospholipid carrier-dependent glycosyltransferase [Sphingomonas bacterium]MDB5706836.1 dolichyl-phosphate-mannose--protein mannosyltransferase [Sphingomonas bacterium]
MTAESPPRPYRAAAIIGLVAQLLFTIRLAVPHKLVFDEVHYVPAARVLLELSGPRNIEHPLLGKELIALGIMLFGDNSFGWRIMSTFAATAVVLGIFAIAWMLFGKLRTATMASLFVLLNITVFIQARIAMLDGFMAAFVVMGIAALLWAMRAPPEKVWRRWLLGSFLLGLAVAAKWAAAPFIAYAAVALIWIRLRDARMRKRSVYAALNPGDQAYWPGLPVVPALIALGVVSIATYCLTFWPAFYYAQFPLTREGFVAFQMRMYAAQTQVLPPHTYQSSWPSWPLMIRPIWYLYEPVDGAMRGILLIGNPAILWGGLIAVAACLYAWVRDGSMKLLAVAGLWIGSYAMWILIPKSIGFFYYYYLPSIFLALPLAGAFDRFRTGRWKHWDEGFLVLCFCLFVYFYPIISAMALNDPQDFRHWMWFSTWP